MDPFHPHHEAACPACVGTVTVGWSSSPKKGHAMKLANNNHTHATSIAVVTLVLAVLGGALQASARQNPGATFHRPSAVDSKDRAKPSILYGSTLFATWGTVTNGNTSANAAEHRKELTGGHAGSANAAEAPAFWAAAR